MFGDALKPLVLSVQENYKPLKKFYSNAEYVRISIIQLRQQIQLKFIVKMNLEI